MKEFHTPSDWEWVVACSEDDWRKVVAHGGIEQPADGLTLGATFLANHITYIRGYYVLHPTSDGYLAQPRHTIAHELGHVTLNTTDEYRAEHRAEELLSGVISISTHK